MFRTYTNLSKETGIIEYIAENLSHQNREEAKIIASFIPLRELLAVEVAEAEKGFVFFDEKGNPYGIGGIRPGGRIFFVMCEGTTTAMHVSALKAGRRWLKEQLEHYHRIDGYCWEENKLSQRWMRWMGFEFADADSAATITVDGHNFLYFVRTK